ncbi:restriction endonuclease subunit S [Vibrio fluvialis]|nr:restriction endonuclease subunit S [Vibrio fluvialis]MBY8015020.1 restriction endonuclease subunit S [Vibrio fluvialis]MBY8019216.1 restriction endonuclease subunit S [Vibrio fluvialis]
MAVENLITEHIDIWTSAVKAKSTSGRGGSKKLELYGVKKLRDLILELAVRGKLVPQDPNDEPASVLLERIASEKAQLIKDKKIKKPKKLLALNDEDIPFGLPEGWEWSQVNELAKVVTDGVHHTPKYLDNGVPFISVKDIDGKSISFDDCKYISQEQHEEINQRCNPEKGDILLCRIGTLGRATIVDTEKAFSLFVSVGLLKFFNEQLLPEYLHTVFHSPLLLRQYDEIKAGGSHTNKLNLGDIPRLKIPVAPLQEQHRIVAKVDELMALCDQLEQQTEASIEAHQVLVTTLLDTLTNSADADELMQNWARISEHFDTLFTTEESIDQLKQTILQLAVMGKLVPQDPSDEPAAELLKRITGEKAQLVKDKVYQKTSKLKPRNELISYPKGWVGVQTGQVCPSIVPNRDRPKSFTGNIPWVTLPAFPQQSLYLDSTKVELALTETEVQKYSARLIPEGSVLMSCVGRFGLTAINTIPVTSNQQVHAFITLKGLLPEYLSMVIRVEGKVLETIATSTTIAYLNKTNCESIQFGLPPENEQRLIVEKAKELIDLCEQLKVRVKEFQATQHNLTDAIVEQAV